MVGRLLQARLINQAHGGPVISMWEIDQLDDVTIDTIVTFVTALPGYQRVHEEQEAKFAAFRAEHLKRH